MSLIRLENVSLRYNKGPRVLFGIDMEIMPGSFHFVTGPSGSGKSSLLKIITQMAMIDEGRVTLFDRDLANLSVLEKTKLRQNIGVVFQDFRLIQGMNIFDNVALPLRLRGQDEGRVQKHVPDLLAWVGLAKQRDRLPSELSGGEQQRVAIARAVVHNPALIIADEPTGNIDDKTGYKLMQLFAELHKGGTTVIVATHHQTLLNFFNYPEIRMLDGRIKTMPHDWRASA
jgi:cell division transport system ATP-binding protein